MKLNWEIEDNWVNHLEIVISKCKFSGLTFEKNMIFQHWETVAHEVQLVRE